MPNGKIQQEFTDTLAVVGNWLKKYGETIYGTRNGPIAAHPWGVSTQKGTKIYVHILSYNDKQFFLPKLDQKVASMILFEDKTKLKFIENELGIVIQLPEGKLNAIDTIIEIELVKK